MENMMQKTTLDTKQLRVNHKTERGMRAGTMERGGKRNKKLKAFVFKKPKLKLKVRIKRRLKQRSLKRLKFKCKQWRKKPRKWRMKKKKRVEEPQIVVVKGRRMRCITRANGRKIYRLPTKSQSAQGWKLRQQKKAKVRKSDKVRVAFRNIVRARNDLELRVLRKRRSYLRNKRFNDYFRGKLGTSRGGAYRANIKHHNLGGNVDVVSNRVAPGMSLRKVRSLTAYGPFARTANIGRWTLRKRQLVRGYVPHDPGTSVGPLTILRFEPRKRYAKVRSSVVRGWKGSRMETLLVQRKSNVIGVKRAASAFENERLRRWWQHGWKQR